MASVEVQRQPSSSSLGPDMQSQVRLPGIQTTGIYTGRIKDRNPEIRAAGKLTATSDSAKLCMKPDPTPEEPEIVQRFKATLRPEAGRKRVFYGKAGDPHLQWAEEMTHGLSSQPSIMARQLLNPQPNSLFRQKCMDKKESIYASHQRAPLGQSHDQTPGMPQKLNPNKFTFGIQTEKDGSAGELITPNKSRAQVFLEDEEGHDLYRRTHCDYRVGEQCNRSYFSPSFNKDSLFGIPTPHANDGKLVKKTLNWLHNADKTAPISKRLDTFRERTQPQLGKVHDPIKDTLNVEPDHTFGILLKPDEYGAGDLIHGRGPRNYLRGHDRERGLIAAMRQHLKKANYHNFQDLMTAFKYYDKSGTGKINIDDLREACIRFNLPAEPELLEQLMDYCDVDRDGQINYLEFSNFLNWKDKLSSGLPSRPVQSAPAATGLRDCDLECKQGSRGSQSAWAPKRLHKQIDMAVGDMRTSASMINAVAGSGGISTRGYRTYGVPSIRTDLPATRIRRIDDRTNYGDESNAYGLTSPSIYSTKGVYEKDFLLPRPKSEIQEVFTNVGVDMTNETFDRLYELAAMRHPQGHVSVESFRNVLDECQAAMLKQSSYFI